MKTLSDLKPGDPITVSVNGNVQIFVVEKIGRTLLHASLYGRITKFYLDTGIATGKQWGYGTHAYTADQWDQRNRSFRVRLEWRTNKGLVESSGITTEALERINSVIRKELGL